MRNHGAKREAKHVNRHMRMFFACVIVYCVEIIGFATSMIVYALACTYASKVKTHRLALSKTRRLHAGSDHFVEHGSLVQRVRMAYDDDRMRCVLRGERRAFK